MNRIVLLAVMSFGLTLAASAQSARVVGGGNAAAGAYPYMTALIEKGASPASGQFCGAALVAPQWVLTAGHCMEGTPASAVEVWIGGRDLRVPSEGVRVAVSQVIMHPNYGTNAQGALVYDFCLLKLARAVTERATLPLVESAAQIAPGITSRAIGWGATLEGGNGASILQQVDLPLVSLATAGGSAAGLGSTHLAAGRASGGIDTCQGDSGGPLLVRNSAGAWAHAGTVSYGNGCARPGEYGIYGNTLTLKSWILGYIGTATPVDDHSNTTTNATTLAVNGTATGTLEKGGDLDVFKIMLTAKGTLVVTSSGSTDVVGTLLGSTGATLLTDDNGAGSPNFRLTYNATAATTLYLRVAGKSSTTTGAYGLSTTFSSAPAPVGDIALRLGTAEVAQNSSVDFGAVAVSASAPSKTLTIANTGNGTLAIGGATVTSGRGFSLSTQPAASVAAGRTTSFVIAFKPTTAGTQTATLTINSNDPDESPYAITLTGTGLVSSTDDHGNTIATATAVTVPSSKAGVLNSGTDLDAFKFTLATSRTVTLRTTGGVDTYGTLYTSGGSRLTQADDTGSDLNFTITRSLAPGTYIIIVEGYSSSDTGPYTLVLQ